MTSKSSGPENAVASSVSGFFSPASSVTSCGVPETSALESASLNVVFDFEGLNRLTVMASDEPCTGCIETISRNWIGLSERK